MLAPQYTYNTSVLLYETIIEISIPGWHDRRNERTKMKKRYFRSAISDDDLLWLLQAMAMTIPVQIFSSDPVVIESICYRTRANRLINESNTTAALRKIWTGSCTIIHIRRSFAALCLCFAKKWTDQRRNKRPAVFERSVCPKVHHGFVLFNCCRSSRPIFFGHPVVLLSFICWFTFVR